MAAMLAENYQLKWHSHGVNLHSSIATLHRSESFSDVTLATADGRYVSAHRFVLSACSAYLHQLFQATRNAYPGLASGVGGGAPLVVVLPADIGYRTLSVLLQYMYSGEATVSQQQLDAVLRAGEILRIKGLCRTGSGGSGSSRHGSGTHKERDRDRAGRPTGVLTRQDPNIRSSRPLESPAADTEGSLQPHLKVGGSKRPASASQGSHTPPNPPPPPAKKSHSLPPPENQKENVEELVGGGSDKQREERERERERESDEGVLGIEQSMQIELLVKEEPIEWDNMDAPPPHPDSDKAVLHSDINIKSEIYSGDDGEEGGDEEEFEEEEFEEEGEGEEGDEEEEEEEEDMSAFYAPLTCDMCGQTFTTPALWVRHTETHPPTELPRRKAKRNTSGGDSTATNGSAMGEKVDEEGAGNEAEYPPLRCELCQEVYSNPGDWVRHIQSAHTEEQLAMSNQSSGGGGRPPRGGTAGGASTSTSGSSRSSRLARTAAQFLLKQAALNGRKHCPLCEKTFPSHASMMVHSRTHTGERPYECQVCAKEFNVKSNLLRHMRTLHDEIINPGNVRPAD